MQELELEAEKYAHNFFEMHETNNYKALKQGFEAGATSKYVEKQKLEFSIKELMWVNILIPFEHQYAKDCIDNKIKELEQKLIELNKK